MEITSFKKQDDKATFNVKQLPVGVINAYRRTIIEAMPVMAIEKIRVYQNNSILNDEVLAHRLGLAPLTTDVKTYNMREQCSCDYKGCGRCTTTLSLEAKGPKTVYTGDLKSTDPEVKPVYETMPLIKLSEGQEIKLEAMAVLGKGRDHIKWQAGIASYDIKKNHVEVTVESYGQYGIDDLIKQSLQEFDKKIKEVKESIG